MDAGATVMYLQFDGVTDSVYEQIRGADLLPLKLKAIENCAEWKVGVILVPTLVKHVNDESDRNYHSIREEMDPDGQRSAFPADDLSGQVSRSRRGTRTGFCSLTSWPPLRIRRREN